VSGPGGVRALRAVTRLGGLAAVAAAGLSLSGPAAAAPWCGSPSPVDRPAAVAGHQIRVVYAFPSDGADESAAFAARISDDVDAVEEWWRVQDPARAPRFDRALFPCGAQADVIAVRLRRTGEELRAEQDRFPTIANLVSDDVDDSPYLKYLVYYDGPLDGDEICGQGGGSFGGAGVAVVYVRACADEPTAVVAAHELLHALGALPAPGPPHACSAEDNGHTCDSPDDILWPFATLVPLSALFLDVGRDDYYDHAGGWPDIRDSAWLRRLDAQVSLALRLQGRGTVESNVPGLECSADCTSEWDAGSQVTLVATPGPGQVFARWSGGCAGRAPSCSLTVAEPMSVGAVFGPTSFPVRVSIAGRGTVRSTPAGIACPGACAGRLPSYTRVRLVAKPARGWRFKAWTGVCRGSAARCTLTLEGAARTRASFTRVRPS